MFAQLRLSGMLTILHGHQTSHFDVWRLGGAVPNGSLATASPTGGDSFYPLQRTAGSRKSQRQEWQSSSQRWLLASARSKIWFQQEHARALTMTAVNLKEKLATFSDYWSPKIVSRFNDHDVMVVKVKGEFNWHSHPDTDDFFLVLKGQVTIRLRDGDVVLNAGEMYVVPKGVEHCPVAEEEAELLLIEPIGTPNTGDRVTAVEKVTI
jgi:mannose-6-phosphate isomerase-like protein (cupin superfamily)